MLEGHLLSERYLIKRTIGGGGMANVYLAEDTILDRDVAIKVLRLEYANDAEFIARFDREAQAATSLSHPNIVNIYDVGEEEHILYMVMEYVNGLTLKEYIQQNGPVEVQEALDIMKQITSAIAHAHAHDFVHRDLKPQNILMDTYGNVKVTDFGIAIALSATSLTQTNAILGSVHYLSPEQARGGMATKKSDIYSLGIVLFELLTGRLPFSGESPVSIALKHLQSNTPSVRRFNPDVPQSVENIVLKATAKDPFHRYNTVYNMDEALAIALHPSIINEELYTPPVEVGEETKAIPIITDNQIQENLNQDTIVHQTDESTKVTNNDSNKKPPKKKRRGRKLGLIIIATLFILLASGIVALFVLPGLLKTKEVTIPDVTGMTYEEAVDELDKVNLEAEEGLTFSEDIDEGLVVKTAPRAGKSVKEKSMITVFISEGNETITFDDYVGQNFSQVQRVLKEKGFSNINQQEVSSDKPSGEIISHIEPMPDSDVVPGKTKVIFEVSSGPELVSLNNLKGLSEKEVKDYLEKNGLSMNKIVENSDSVAKEHVIRQSPEANTNVKKGDTVDVYISAGLEESPPSSHSVTFTVPYTLGEQSGGKSQKVMIYIDDMNHTISDVFEEDSITEDKEFTITLTIEPDKQAEYKVIRDNDVILDKTIPYKEGG